MRPFLPALGTLALLGGLLTGCGEDDGGGGTDAASGGDTSSFCDQASGLEERFASLESSTEPTPELFQEVSDAFGELAEDAPDEISDDMETLAGALATFAEVFKDVDPDDPSSLAVLEEEAERLEAEGEDLEEASTNVEAYFRDECGIDLDEEPGTGGAAPTEGEAESEGGSGSEGESGSDGGSDDGGETGTQLDEELEDEG